MRTLQYIRIIYNHDDKRMQKFIVENEITEKYEIQKGNRYDSMYMALSSEEILILKILFEDIKIYTIYDEDRTFSTVDELRIHSSVNKNFDLIRR